MITAVCLIISDVNRAVVIIADNLLCPAVVVWAIVPVR